MHTETLLKCYIQARFSLFQALGRWGQSNKCEGAERDLVEKKARSSLIPLVARPCFA